MQVIRLPDSERVNAAAAAVTVRRIDSPPHQVSSREHQAFELAVPETHAAVSHRAIQQVGARVVGELVLVPAGVVDAPQERLHHLPCGRGGQRISHNVS